MGMVICGDVLDILRDWPGDYFDCCVTSPPYWGLRDYGVTGQLGLEPTPVAYVSRMVEVFREVRRVLKKEGTLWLNLGDSYAGSGKGAWDNKDGGQKEVYIPDSDSPQTQIPKVPIGLKPKDLIGIPWRVALALQADGWWLRQDIVWAKPNPMPESVTDRCTKSHEYIFMMTKSAKYWYDAAAIKEPVADASVGRAARKQKLIDRTGQGTLGKQIENGVDGTHAYAGLALGRNGKTGYDLEGGRNKRDVWTVATQPFPGSHFAVFPAKLIEPCILAGCPERVCSKCGKPWKSVVEKKQTGRGETSSQLQDGINVRSSGKSLAEKRQAYRAMGMEGPPAPVVVGYAPTCACGAGTSPGVVLDPFIGSGTVGMVATQHGRDYVGIELNPEYAAMAEKRIIAGK